MDIDFLTVASMGLAPAWGGILSWGDKYGLKRAVERTKELAAKLHLPELKPSPRLQAEAAKGGVLRPDLPATGAPRGAGEQPKLAPAGPSYVEAAVVALLGAAAFHIISGRSSKL